MSDGDDFVTSPSDEEIVASIRSRYIQDSSVGVVLIGPSTWARRFVDWEIAAAMGGPSDPAVPLVLFDLQPRARSRTPLPPRLTSAGVQPLGRVEEPQSLHDLAAAVDQAIAHARTSEFTPQRAEPLLRCDLT